MKKQTLILTLATLALTGGSLFAGWGNLLNKVRETAAISAQQVAATAQQGMTETANAAASSATEAGMEVAGEASASPLGGLLGGGAVNSSDIAQRLEALEERVTALEAASGITAPDTDTSDDASFEEVNEDGNYL